MASSTPIDSRLNLLILGLVSPFLNEQFKWEKNPIYWGSKTNLYTVAKTLYTEAQVNPIHKYFYFAFYHFDSVIRLGRNDKYFFILAAEQFYRKVNPKNCLQIFYENKV